MLLVVLPILRMPQLLGDAEAPLADFQTQSIRTVGLYFTLSLYYFFLSSELGC